MAKSKLISRIGALAFDLSRQTRQHRICML